MERNELIAYAMDFASYLISKTEGVNQIILHGSIARGDYDEKSDVDLFIDADKKLEKKVNLALENYYKTNKYKEWKLKGIDKEFSLIIANLNGKEWKNLKRAIMNTGILLYGKYKSGIEKTNQYTLLSFENIKPDAKRISIFRKIFGFKIENKIYKGLAEEVNAIRIGKGSLLVPIEHSKKIIDYFNEKKVQIKVYDFWTDEKFM